EGQLVLREARAEGDRMIEEARAEVRRLEEQLNAMERTRRGYIAQIRVLVERQLAELNAAESADQASANGRPGIHHVFARTLKDLFCRYHTMRGALVQRKAGWDTHGLPVEIEV